MLREIFHRIFKTLFDFRGGYPHNLGTPPEYRPAPQNSMGLGALSRSLEVFLPDGDFADDFHFYAVIITEIAVGMMVEENGQTVRKWYFLGKFHPVAQILSDNDAVMQSL